MRRVDVREDVRAAAERASRLVKLQTAVNRVTDMLAALPFEQQARWLVHILATLDQCESNPNRFDERVLECVRGEISRRLETAEW